MSPEKLEALRKLATDERTPTEEARTAAMQYAKHAGSADDERVKTLQAQVDSLRAQLADEKRLRADDAKKAEQKQKGLEAERDALQDKMIELGDAISVVMAFMGAAKDVKASKPAAAPKRYANTQEIRDPDFYATPFYTNPFKHKL